jgi:hypothetical protein
VQNRSIIRPVNSLIFVSDSAGGHVPEWRPDRLILHTDTCISIGCYPEQDGPTEVVLGVLRDVDPGSAPAFVGELKTPNNVVVVSSVTRERILDMAVTEKIVSVKIWLSHPQWPQRVIIGIAC